MQLSYEVKVLKLHGIQFRLRFDRVPCLLGELCESHMPERIILLWTSVIRILIVFLFKSDVQGVRQRLDFSLGIQMGYNFEVTRLVRRY